MSNKDKITGTVEWADKNNNTKGIIILTNDGYYIFPCPYCLLFIKVKADELNCRIFRHGCFKKNGKGINPHLSKEKCTELVHKACIYGCAGPFEFIGGGKGKLDDENCIVRICDYK